MKCPCCCRVSNGVVSCELDYPHEGRPHQDGDVSWINTMKLTFTGKLDCPDCQGSGWVGPDPCSCNPNPEANKPK